MGNVQTRQFDARGMNHRRGSISWNFQYPSTSPKRQEPSKLLGYNPKLTVQDWLEELDLQEYDPHFHMYNRVERILDFGDNDLKSLGVSDNAHRTKMLSSLMAIKAKRRQSMSIEVSSPLEKPISRTSSPPLPPRNKATRKNSCPPMHLSETMRGSGSLFKRNEGKRRDEPLDHIYEEIKPRPSELLNPPATHSHDPNESDPFNANNNDRTNCTMETGTHHSHTSPSHNNGVAAAASAATITNEQQEEMKALKKALEWELSLDSKELRSHAWYHGPLPRQRAEEIVQREGDFLIRDCASQPDNYVLTCRTRSAVLHFVINKILLQPETVYERVQYQFEEDAFDAIPDLITFYVGSGKPISAASGARIQYPCNRTYPLSFYGHKIINNHLHMQMLSGGVRCASPLNSPLSQNGGSGSFKFVATTPQAMPQHALQSPLSSPPRNNHAPLLPSKKQQRSQSLTPAQAMVLTNRRNAEMGMSSESLRFHANGNGCSEHINGVERSVIGRRFSHFEKSNSISEVPGEGGGLSAGGGMPLQMRLEQLSQAGKLNGSGFQTIARCTANEPSVDHFKFTTHSLPRPTTTAHLLRQTHRFGRTSSLARDFSLDSSSSNFFSSLEGNQIPELPEKPPSPPPIPYRVPTLPRKDKEYCFDQQQQALHRAAAAAAAAVVYQASGSDSGNGSGDSIQSSTPGDFGEFVQHRGVIIKNPRFMSNSASSATLTSLSEFDAAATEEQLFIMELPEIKPTSRFDLENFSTLLLPAVENNPLDGDALNTFKVMLLETGPKMVAEHITRIDIGLLINDDEEPEGDDESEAETKNPASMLTRCGLELLTLPQGKAFRTDLIERTQSMKLMVAVTILTCQTDLDRAELLSKWIQIAVETKTALGNLFGFSAIMLGLCMPQIQKLDNAWHILRQKYTDSAFTFEAKLRPTLISMNECANPQAPNTTVPHVLIYALLKDRPVMDIINVNSTNEQSSLHTICITAWEKKADDFGLAITYLHFDSARTFLKNLPLYRKNSQIILEESNSRMDELLGDAFRTEFHVKFLWGSCGALASAEDRHTKLEKVLTLMADRFANSTTGA